MLRVAVLSCYRLLSASLARLINGSQDMEVVAVVDDWNASGEVLSATPIDVLIMEVNTSKVEHLAFIDDTLQRIPHLNILILCSQTSEIYPDQYLDAGAKGFLCRRAELDEVIHAIKEVGNSQSYLSANYLQRLGEQQLSGELGGHAILSKRELQILLLITNGSKVGAICEVLKLSPKTVNTYRYRIFDKLGLDSDVSLARWAIRQGLIEA